MCPDVFILNTVKKNTIQFQIDEDAHRNVSNSPWDVEHELGIFQISLSLLKESVIIDRPHWTEGYT